MRRLVVYTVALLACAALPASAEQLRYRFRPGQVIESRGAMAGATLVSSAGSPMSKMQFRVAVKQTQRVRSVRGGVVTLEVTDTPLSGTVTMQGRKQPYRQPVTKALVTLTERGRFLSRKLLSGDDNDSGADGMEAANAFYGLNFPDRDLKPGDTWEDEIKVGTRTVRMSCRYAGRQKFRGRDCVRITSTVTMQLGEGEPVETSDEEPSAGAAGKVTGTMTTYFDPRAGVEVHSTGSVVMLVRAALPSQQDEPVELASVMKINMLQSLVSTAGAGK